MSILELSTTTQLTTTVVSGRRSELRLKFVSASSRAEALFVWRKLEIELSNQRLTCSSVWTATWLDHYGTLVPHQFAIGMKDGIICGIALVTQGVRQNAGPFPLKTWHIGTAGEPESESVCVEYNSLLARPDDRLEFGHALWKWALETTHCDEFRMDGFEMSSIEPFLTHNPQAQVTRRSSYYFDLATTRNSGEEPLMRLSVHTRYNIRRTLRDLGGTRGEWADTVGRAESLFHQMVQLHQARWNKDGMPGVYASRRFRDFHLDLLNRCVPLGTMAMYGITAGQRLIACCQMLMDDHRVLFYQCGRIPATGRFSYGMVLDYMCICESLNRGYAAADFMAGDTDHKRRLSTNRSELAWIVWRRLNFKNIAIDALRRIKQLTLQLRISDSTTGRIGTRVAVQPDMTSEGAE